MQNEISCTEAGGIRCLAFELPARRLLSPSICIARAPRLSPGVCIRRAWGGTGNMEQLQGGPQRATIRGLSHEVGGSLVQVCYVARFVIFDIKPGSRYDGATRSGGLL